MFIEEWKAIKGTNEGYEVSSLGNIRSKDRIIVRPDSASYLRKGTQFSLKPHPKLGYRMLRIARDGKRQTFTVHFLVAEAFLGERPRGLQIRHLNGDRSDCRVANLAYGSASDNYNDSRMHGTNAKGQKHGAAKLTERDVLSIRQRLKIGHSRMKIAKEFGITRQTVGDIARKRRWGWLASIDPKGPPSA